MRAFFIRWKNGKWRMENGKWHFDRLNDVKTKD